MAQVDNALDKHYVETVRRYYREQGGGGRYYKDAQLLALREVCPDADLLATALRMQPLPQWVQDVLP